MRAYELFKSDGTPCGIFACDECRIVYSPKFFPDALKKAEECCDKRCIYCDDKLEKQSGYTSCDKCRKRIEAEKEKEKFVKAEKVSAKDWDGPVFADIGPNDGFFESMSELEEYVEDNNDDSEDKIVMPAYVWACHKRNLPKIDVYNVCESNVIDYLPEDYSFEDLNGYDELQTALDKFVEDNQDFWVCDIDYKKAVVFV